MNLKLKETDRSDRIPLQALVDVNYALGVIIKHSYKTLAGVQPRGRAPELKIYAAKFESGSYLSQLVLEISSRTEPGQLAFAFASVPPEEIFKVAKCAIEFWKILKKILAAGQKVNINIKAEPGAIVLLNHGNGTLDVSRSVIQTAAQIPAAGEQLTKPLRRGELEAIEIEPKETGKLLLTSDDANCFETPLDVDTSVKEAIGDLVEFDKKKLRGIFEYMDGITPVRRTFSLPSNASILSAIESMKKRCRMFFHEEFIQLPGNDRVVVRLQAIKVEPID